MSLVERYIAQVGRRLPEKNRADIEAEIRSMLEDMLEEKNQAGAANEANVKAALQQLGDPALLAEKYSPSKRYLIGPGWYDAYLEVLKRVLTTVLPIVLTVTFLVRLANEPGDVIGSFLGAAGFAFSAGLQVCFWVTLGFIIAEREGAPLEDFHGNRSRVWTPDQLPPLPKKRQMDISEAITSIALVLGGAILMALSPQILSIQSNGETIPFLHPNLWRVWLPIFFVLVGLTMIHELFKLKIGIWTRALTVTNVILGLASITYILLLVTTQEVVNPAFVAGMNAGMPTLDVQNSTEWAVWTVGITAAIIIGIYIWDMVESIRLARAYELQKKQHS